MTNYDALSSLDTLVTNNYDYTTVNAAVTGTPLSADIIVETRTDYQAAIKDVSNGILIMERVRSTTTEINASYRHETHEIPCELMYKDSDTEVILAIADEIDRVFGSNNQNPSNDQYSWDFDFNTDYASGKVEFTIQINRYWVSVTT